MIPMSARKTDASLYEREDRCICLYPGTNIACTLFVFIKALGYGQGSEYYSVSHQHITKHVCLLKPLQWHSCQCLLCDTYVLSLIESIMDIAFPLIRTSYYMMSLSSDAGQMQTDAVPHGERTSSRLHEHLYLSAWTQEGNDSRDTKKDSL